MHTYYGSAMHVRYTKYNEFRKKQVPLVSGTASSKCKKIGVFKGTSVYLRREPTRSAINGNESTGQRCWWSKTSMATSVAMSSFQKRTGSGSINISGTKISSSNSGLLVSTGIASLDAVIGKLCFSVLACQVNSCFAMLCWITNYRWRMIISYILHRWRFTYGITLSHW